MKKKISQLLSFVMVFGLLLNNIPSSIVEAATQAVTVVRSTDTTSVHADDEEIEVTLKVTGTPDTTHVDESDIMLIIDKSGSMGDPNYPQFADSMTPTKEAVNEFLDLVDFDYHQVGIVDYSSEAATQFKGLTTDVDELKEHVDTIKAEGGTYTHYAINLATEELINNAREDAQKVIILLTDGEAKNTAWALEAAEKAKAAGITFYTIAVLAEGTNLEDSAANDLLVQMATTGAHHHYVLGTVGIDTVYKNIAKEIGVSCAYNATITETVSDEFEIVEGSYASNIPQPTVDGNTLSWNLKEVKEGSFELIYKVKAKSGTTAGAYNISAGSSIQYYNYSGKEFNYTLKNTSVNVINYAPVISSTSLEKAHAAGGESITIKGENFLEGATVKFGSKAATDVVVVDSNTITATVPAGNQGSTTITVTNTDKQYGTYEYAYYANPEVTSISPATGTFEGGENITINGNYFDSNVKVYFGTEEATMKKYYNTGYIIVTAPKAVEAGLVNITIVNGDGTETTVEDAYTYQEEIVKTVEVTSLSVTTSTIDGGVRAYVYGKNFESGCKVYFGDVEAEIVKFYNSGSIYVTIPAQTGAGVVDVKVENPDGTIGTLENGFEYYVEEEVLSNPEITSITLDTDTISGGTLMYIEGSDFVSGATVKFGDVEASSITFYGTTKIRVKVPANNEGVVSITVTNPDGQSAVLENCFEYYVEEEVLSNPQITSITLDTDTTAGGTLMYIEGSDFVSGATVKFGDVEASSITLYGTTKMRVKVPANNEGVVSITVTNPDGQSAVLENCFEYTPLPLDPAPEITSISMDTDTEDGGTLMYINGTGFKSGLSVKFGDAEATSITMYGSTKVRVKVPANKAGVVSITLTNADGQSAVLEDAFTYTILKPTITKLSVTKDEIEGGIETIVYGTNFDSSTKVYFGENEAKIISVGSTSIRVYVPETKTSGVVDVKVVRGNGESAILEKAFTYNSPTGIETPTISFISTTGAESASITECAAYTLLYFVGTNYNTTDSVVNIYNESGDLVNTITSVTRYNTVKLRIRLPKTMESGNYKVTIANIADGTESEGFDLKIK